VKSSFLKRTSEIRDELDGKSTRLSLGELEDVVSLSSDIMFMEVGPKVKGLVLGNNEKNTSEKINEVYNAMGNLIKEKNKRYGDSVLQPLGIFGSHVEKENSEALNGILVRLDDKLKRIKNSEALRKNDVSDLMGYLAFLCVDQGWNNFDDLID
jgi:hypothetical protein